LVSDVLDADLDVIAAPVSLDNDIPVRGKRQGTKNVERFRPRDGRREVDSTKGVHVRHPMI
jgi:hypothetical protein